MNVAEFQKGLTLSILSLKLRSWHSAGNKSGNWKSQSGGPSWHCGTTEHLISSVWNGTLLVQSWSLFLIPLVPFRDWMSPLVGFQNTRTSCTRVSIWRKREALEKLMKLKEIESKENRSKQHVCIILCIILCILFPVKLDISGYTGYTPFFRHSHMVANCKWLILQLHLAWRCPWGSLGLCFGSGIQTRTQISRRPTPVDRYPVLVHQHSSVVHLFPWDLTSEKQ